MRGWTQAVVAAPGIGVALLPKLACPACWPAYAGLLSSVGLGFLISTVYLLPLTVAFLLLALCAMAFRAKSRHGYRPLLLGLVGSVGVVAGKFLWESNAIMYGALALLIAASVWNTWPKPRVRPNPACAACDTSRSTELGNEN